MVHEEWEDGPDAMPLADVICECKRCPEKALFILRDMRCVGWVHDEGRDTYATDWAYEGPLHFLCDKHRRKARFFGEEAVQERFRLEKGPAHAT